MHGSVCSMRSQFSHASGQRPLDSLPPQQSACSCSYPLQPIRNLRPRRHIGHVVGREQPVGRRPSSACGAGAASGPDFCGAARSRRQRGERLRCFTAAEDVPGPDSVISGYTPANYISFSENEKDVASHAFEIEVNAPASICFGIWNDWNRLVEFLDLVAQIGLDVNNPDLALFQCFYRHGLLPVMEIVFVLQKTEVVQDKRIAFESVWGMPLSGSVTFKPLKSGKTRVRLAFSQSLPDLLVDLKVGIFGVQNSLMPIFSENLLTFRSIAETAARDPSALPPRQEAGERAYVLFDEDADIAAFEEIMESVQFDDEDEGEEGEGEEDEDQLAGSLQQQEGDEEEGEEEGEEQLAPNRSSGASGLAGASAAALGAAVAARRAGSGASSSVNASTSDRVGQDSRTGPGRGTMPSSSGEAGPAAKDAAGTLTAASTRRPTSAARGTGRAAAGTVSEPGTASSGAGGAKKRPTRSRGAA